MAAPVNVPIEMAKLRAAFDFIGVGAEFEHSAHVCLDTGKVYCRSTLDEEADAELPADLDTSDRYVSLPDASDLGLGRRLALSFTAQELAADYDTVANYFRRRGAYGRFKDLQTRPCVSGAWK